MKRIENLYLFFSLSLEKGFDRLVRLQNTNGTLYPTDQLVCNDDRPASHSPFSFISRYLLYSKCYLLIYDVFFHKVAHLYSIAEDQKAVPIALRRLSLASLSLSI